jgi:DNA-binding NarL/FixJ family response regulator
LQQRFKYHLIRFALLHRWELVHEWLEASLHTNLGLTPQQWQLYTAQLDDKQRSLLELKQQGQPDEKIAKTLGLSMAQLQKQWFKILEQAWEIRNSLVSGSGASTHE